MKYVRVGGLELSAISYGTWHLPISPETYPDGVHKVDEARSKQIIKRAYDLGINFFDTANVYVGSVSAAHAHYEHAGTSERILGAALAGYDRESFVLATKVRAKMAAFHNGEGLSRKHIMWQLGQSLERLGMTYVDLYYIHWSDPGTPHEETMSVLNDLVHEGRVHYIGVSNHSPEDMVDLQEIAERRGWEKFRFMQDRYNLLQRDAELSKLPVARRYRMGFVAYSPLAQGVLAGRYLAGISDGSRASLEPGLVDFIGNTSAAVSTLNELAASKGLKLSQMALAWLMNVNVGVPVIPIVGATTVEELEEDVVATDVKLTEDDMKAVDEALRRRT
ncbi:MAG: aldo/keto reductase [Thermoprotei archaeon]